MEPLTCYRKHADNVGNSPSPTSTPHLMKNPAMFDCQRTLRFHLELTDKCNAACPMCERTLHDDHCATDWSKVRNVEITLDDIRRSFTPSFCRRVERIDICGRLGDPPAARDCLAICEYLVDRGILVTISSNGGLRSEKWWRDLGTVFHRNGSFVEFHIDGLEDTNHLYRVNTRYEKVIRNAQAYMGAGAAAEWHYILFRHNEHQVEEALRRSRELGFRSFKLIDTIRFGDSGQFGYQLPDGTRRKLEPATRRARDIASLADSRDEGAGGEPVSRETGQRINGILCKSARENRPYINADGTVSACCWMPGSPNEREIYERAGRSRRQHSIKESLLPRILEDEPYASLFRKSWEESASPVCIRKCGRDIRNKRHEL